MSIIGHFRARRLAQELDELGKFYDIPRSAEEIRTWQLAKLNSVWEQSALQTEYYSDLTRHGRLPAAFGSWEHFDQTVPITDRTTLQREGARLYNRAYPFARWMSTGGSTSQPIRFPVWKGESSTTTNNIWLGRRRLGIAPDDRLFLLWGHSHLLGSGLMARVRGWRRRVQDAALGYRRFSAYDLTDVALHDAGAEILHYKPKYLLGYSVAVDRLAHANASRSRDFASLGLKAVICTAEGLPHPDSADVIRDTFGCGMYMEYGCVETGPLAYQGRDGRYAFFWRDFYIETSPTQQHGISDAWEILVTTLNPRAMPLVRYRLGDLIDANPSSADFDQTFRKVVGRCNEIVVLRSGKPLHSEVIAHAVKGISAVTAYQIKVSADGAMCLMYMARHPLSEDAETELRTRLRQIDAQLGTVVLQHAPALEQTVAGKTRFLVQAGV